MRIIKNSCSLNLHAITQQIAPTLRPANGTRQLTFRRKIPCANAMHLNSDTQRGLFIRKGAKAGKRKRQCKGPTHSRGQHVSGWSANEVQAVAGTNGVYPPSGEMQSREARMQRPVACTLTQRPERTICASAILRKRAPDRIQHLATGLCSRKSIGKSLQYYLAR